LWHIKCIKDSDSIIEKRRNPRVKMAICPQCGVEYDTGQEFCRKCGSLLLTEEEGVPREEKTEIILICPKCRVLFKEGNYCKKCGSLLVRGIQFLGNTIELLGKRSIKKWSKEWMRLFEDKKELELCLSKFETQRGRISSDNFDPIFLRYQDQLKGFSSLHQEIEAEVEFIRKRASEEIEFSERELKPLRKRLEVFQFLYHRDAITKADFLREKIEIRKEIKSNERSLKRNRQIVSLLPDKVGESSPSSRLTRNLLRPLTLITASVIFILMSAGGYFLWQWHSQDDRPISTESIASPLPPLPPPSPDVVIDTQEVEKTKIRSLLENIRQANLRKDIDLFMSCYSEDFNGRERKRLDTLETWKQVNYLDLSYDLKKQTISDNTANVRLEWLIRISSRAGGQLQDNRILMDITLKRQDGGWKIKEIKSVS